MVHQGKEIVIYPSKWKTFLMSALSLAMLAAALFPVAYREELEVPVFEFTIFCVGILFFGFCFAFFSFRLILPRPAVIMSNERFV